MNSFIDEFKRKLILSGLASRWSIKGCRDYEIKRLEEHFGIKLPLVYKDFLNKMGHGAGKFYQGTDLFYKQLFYNREALEEVLECDDYPFKLEATVFVFSSHQGYIFHFFDVREGAIDPSVYGYKEEDLHIKRINDTFSDFLLESLEEQKQGWFEA